MTVSELIDRLAQFDGDAIVRIADKASKNQNLINVYGHFCYPVDTLVTSCHAGRHSEITIETRKVM